MLISLLRRKQEDGEHSRLRGVFPFIYMVRVRNPSVSSPIQTWLVRTPEIPRDLITLRYRLDAWVDGQDLRRDSSNIVLRGSRSGKPSIYYL